MPASGRTARHLLAGLAVALGGRTLMGCVTLVAVARSTVAVVAVTHPVTSR